MAKFELISVDKARYRNHLNKVIAASVIGLTAISLGLAQVLIALFPSEAGTHFHWNLTGVIVGCLVVGLCLNRVKQHSFMTEVYYVWRLKQTLNLISRKLTKIKAAAEQNNVNAMIVLNFYYQGSRQLWNLDDNTITMDELGIWQAALTTRAQECNVQLNVADFNTDLLEQF